MDRLVRLARWFGSQPAAQLVLGAAILMIAVPATASGTIGRLIVCGAIGIGIAAWWPNAPRALRHPPRGTILMIVAAVGVVVFWDTLTQSPDWQMGDWGPQHAVLAHIMPSLPGLDVPVWNHAVSTGDAPLELYPALTYLFVGHLALVLGLANDLQLAFMVVAVLVHLALAVTTTAMVARVASRPVALALGLLWLVDSGAISHGGTVGLFHWALLHSAFAHVFSMIAALGIMAALERPRIGASVAIWVGTAIATAAHPAALITAASCMLALGLVAVLASDVPPRRALAAMGHLALGVALGASVWLPSSERLLAYGQHFPNELMTSVRLIQTVMAFAMPLTAYSLIVYIGYLGILVGMWTRRAEVVFVTVVAFVMLIGLCDAPYLAFGLTPGQTVARLGAIRMMLLARPFVFAAAGFAIAALVRVARASWAGAPQRSRFAAAAVLGVMAGSALRILPDYWRAETERAVTESQQYANDPDGRAQLTAWATEQVKEIGPERYARAMFEEDTHEHLHLTAITGLPSFHLMPMPDLLLRERIENPSPESLARFDVRWVIGVGRPPAAGDPQTEKQIGTYYVREVHGWDGKFARIERGSGTVKTVRLDDRAVEIEVDAKEPVLVALGMGFYPRWRAHHASGADEPVFAYPTVQGGYMHVVSAWVAPGRTIFTCDGPLPSDHDGRLLSLLAAAAALAGVIAWRRPRWRVRALRGLARARRRIGLRTIVEYGVPAFLAVMVVRGCMTTTGRTQAVLVGSGVRATAKVEARVEDGDWQDCGYSMVTGAYRCEDLVSVSDATVNMLNDAAPSWPFITPAILAQGERDGVEVRVTRDVKLNGRYWAGCSYGAATIVLGNDTREIRARTIMDFASGNGPLTLTFKAPESGVYVTIVGEETLQPERTFLEAPPAEAPGAVSAIH